jgi:hypothetical protein
VVMKHIYTIVGKNAMTKKNSENFLENFTYFFVINQFFPVFRYQIFNVLLKMVCV